MLLYTFVYLIFTVSLMQILSFDLRFTSCLIKDYTQTLMQILFLI